MSVVAGGLCQRSQRVLVPGEGGGGAGWPWPRLAGWLARAAPPDHDFTEVTPGTPRPPHHNHPESETRESRVTWPADYGSTL